jgi:hypothetical protein
VTPHLEILPPAQRAFWDRHAAMVPRHFVLYGDTAIALRLGHRTSVDFDLFSSRPLDEAAIRESLPILARSTLLQQDPETLVLTLPLGDGEVKLSFFGSIAFGRVGVPDEVPDRLSIASPIDLLATKLKVVHQRVEARDYLDIEALLRSGLSLNDGISAARALYGEAVNPLMTAKAVAWFSEGGLDKTLPPETRHLLERASATLDLASAMRPAPLRSNDLSRAE